MEDEDTSPPAPESNSVVRRRTRIDSHLTKYGSSKQPPPDDAVHYHEDDTHSFFAKGRDFESVYVNHRYTIQERETLASFESLDYLPSHSTVYKHWIKRQPARLDWDRWLMMGFIGFAVGLIGFFLHQLIDVIAEFRQDKAREFIEDGDILIVWGWVFGYSVLFVLVGTGMVVLVRPSAGGSGLPELIGFLNGTVVRHIFNIKTLIIKFLSCVCSVASGLPVGPEGPMIHMGSLVGAGLSQFKSDTLRVTLPFFERFRNSEDRRNFISAGAAAGVASAFGAPVGGLLFSMEEVSSFWNQKLSWQIFFCSMVSTFTTDLFNSAFTAFRYQGNFGLFKADKYILFQIDTRIAVNILAMFPAIIIGILGGLFGALFNFVNLKIARTRKRVLSKMTSPVAQKITRMAEPVLIMMIMATIAVFLPAAVSCTQYTCAHNSAGTPSPNCLVDSQNPLHIEPTVERYTCPEGIVQKNDNYTWTNQTFNEVATLLFVTGENAIKHLYSRNTHLEFGYASLCAVLPIYFFLACWSAGTSISSGIVVPMLYIGALYGRLVGRIMVSMFGVHTEADSYWAWIDPGAFALVGSASFFGGVTRLTMSLTVIMMELTNDVQFLLPIMATIMVAKWVGDFITHPLYHATLELKCIPFLDSEPVIVHDAKDVVNLELFEARSIMAPHPITIHGRESVSLLAHLLLDTTHGGFPIVKRAGYEEVFFGFINRLELTVLLKNEDMFLTEESLGSESEDIAHIDYQRLTLDKLGDPINIELMLQRYCTDEKFERLYLNIEPYVNQSSVCIQEKFSLHRTYIIFRTLGLRHLTVVDEHNHVVGIITRKDLMGFNMEEKLNDILHTAVAGSRDVEMIEGSPPVPSSVC